MATEDRYFYEDEVFRINKKGYIEFGMVLQNSELVSSDDSETGGDPKIKKGHIRVAWHPTGAEEVVPERKVKIASFLAYWSPSLFLGIAPDSCWQYLQWFVEFIE